MTARLLSRLGREDGMGLVELLTAMVILTIALGALLTAYTASVRSLERSGAEGTALTVADRQMESYRSLPFTCIALNGGTAPAGCPSASGFPNPYSATQTPSGTDTPDHRTYTVTTSISTASGVSAVTVSVTNSGGTELARESSTFSSTDFPASTTGGS